MKYGIAVTGKAAMRALAVLTALIILSVSLDSQALSATALQQEPGGRFRVLVVPLESSVLDKRFGEKVSRALSERLEDFPTHAPIAEREYKNALKRYEVKQEDLTKIKARQLGNLMGAQVVYYGTISAAGAAFDVEASFIDVATGDEVAVPPLMIRDKSDDSVDQIADASVSAFEEAVRFVRARAFCAEYVGSQQPENALRNCNEALDINPVSIPALYNKGMAFRQLYESETESGMTGTNGWADSAVSYFEGVLENSPGHRDAMQNAAYIYSQMGQAGKASDLYTQYLELDPANVPIRLKVADDLARADLMSEAIVIIQAGLEFTPNDVDLLQFLGDYSLRYSSVDSSYVDIAVESYGQILEIKGEETDLRIIENTIAALTLAGRTDDALEFADRALGSHADSPRLWSLYADALGRAERYDEAVAAVDQVIALDASYPRAYLKRGQLKLEAGDAEGALADFNTAIQSGSSSQDEVFRFFWSRAITARQAGELSGSLSDFQYAAQFAPAANRQEVEFFWGYTLYQIGERQATPEDAGISQLQRAQRNFNAAKDHFQRAGSVRPEVPQLVDACDRWLLNVDARIRQIQRGN
jgi:tetratricopeptide (TPR) repeat protein